jgi:hypothetical protein
MRGAAYNPWHYPNRTPERCGWRAPKGEEKTLIGNWYSTRFADAWEAAVCAAEDLERLEKGARQLAAAPREMTLPAAVKEAASANFSTLAAQTCFRTADGEFHGFEGGNDHLGCCTGSCAHVWNYETTTPYLFPPPAHSLRAAMSGHSTDEHGAMHIRPLPPDGKERFGFAAADGKMGQIIHAYLGYALSGDRERLRACYPRIRKSSEYCWRPGSWDADRAVCDGRRAAQPARHGVLRAEPAVRDLLPGRPARGAGTGARRRRRRYGRRAPPSVCQRPGVDRREPV